MTDRIKRFFVDNLDGEGTVAYTHVGGDTESIVTIGVEEFASNIVDHLNYFFGEDYKTPLLPGTSRTELGDDPKYRQGYADGQQEVLDYVSNFGQ